MFLVEDKRHGANYLVFTVEDPRKAGFNGAIVEGVTLDYDLGAVHSWPDGQEAPNVSVGQSASDPKHFKVFRTPFDRDREGYSPVSGTALQFGSWKEYARLHLIPPDPDQFDDEVWYDYLDKVDDDASRRRQRQSEILPPLAHDRDTVAAWVAKKHLVADNSIREVWYLPNGASPDEIRLLELNDRLGTLNSDANAIDFGLDVNGARFRLLVADISSEQLDRIKKGRSNLPTGWSLADNQVWGRRL